MSESIFGNPVTHPKWLLQSHWFGDMRSSDREIRYPNYLNLSEERATLKYQILGDWQCPSGKLISGSLIMDLKAGTPSNSDMILFVPRKPCQVTAIWIGKKDYFEQAYLSLRWDSSTSLTQRNHAVVPRKDYWGHLRDVFFVDKSLFAFFDYESFLQSFSNQEVLTQYLNDLLKPSFYEKPNPLFFTKEPSGVLGEARNGIASAILEYEADDTVKALHFDFNHLHSSGEDGEYDEDWEFAQEARELRKRMGF